MTTVATFQQVAAGQVSPSDAADRLMAERSATPKKPVWMPKWLYVLSVVVVTVLFAPIVSPRER